MVETVKKIVLKTCEGRPSGSISQIKAVMKNIDNQRCTTNALKSLQIAAGEYVESTNIGEACLRTPIKNGEVKVWLINESKIDSLCVTDVYLDTSSSPGFTRQLKCRVNRDNSYEDARLNGLPLSCK